VFPFRYELNVYMLFRQARCFKELTFHKATKFDTLGVICLLLLQHYISRLHYALQDHISREAGYQ
jgi:hypothetical protein